MLNLKTKAMKKLLLCGSALVCSLGALNAQGWYSTGVYDDFKDSTFYVNGANNEGAYWWENTSGNAVKLSRKGDGSMLVTATNAGGCTSGSYCYPIFGVNFGQDANKKAFAVDLSTLADITIDIENMVNVATYVSIILEDANGKQAKIEPNISDVIAGTPWDSASIRKSLNGFTFGDLTDPGVKANVRKKLKIDLSSVAGKIGGLSAGDADWTCATPVDCPKTSYAIDPSKITNVLFMLNFGKNNIFISEGTTNTTKDYKEDTFIDGTNISPYTGSLKVYEFAIGTLPQGLGFKDGINEKTVHKLNLYPNPASDLLNVSFETKSVATVTLTDIFGRAVYTHSANAGTNNIAVNTSNLSTGIYILNVASENGSVSNKVNIK